MTVLIAAIIPIQYYDWDGLPCRVVTGEDGSSRAETYLAGRGFQPAPYLEVTREGYVVSETEFKRMVAQTRR